MASSPLSWAPRLHPASAHPGFRCQPHPPAAPSPPKSKPSLQRGQRVLPRQSSLTSLLSPGTGSQHHPSSSPRLAKTQDTGRPLVPGKRGRPAHQPGSGLVPCPLGSLPGERVPLPTPLPAPSLPQDLYPGPPSPIFDCSLGPTTSVLTPPPSHNHPSFSDKPLTGLPTSFLIMN